jgi:ribosome-associated protein
MALPPGCGILGNDRDPRPAAIAAGLRTPLKLRPATIAVAKVVGPAGALADQTTMEITPTLVIDESELEERFVRASGPGGQNVNKVATAVQLRFDAAASPSLDERTRRRLRAIAGTRMTADGVIVIDARRHRTQAKNREDARERLIELVREAATPPKRRRKTAPTQASQERRFDSKRRRAEAKQRRRPIGRDD